MSNLTLIIGNRTQSSWSLRGWLALAHSGLPYRTLSLDLFSTDFKQQALQYSPAGKVPVLLVGETPIWDSLAIGEYLAEQVPELWPQDPLVRARARSLCADMHSSFQALRQQMPMDLSREDLGVPMTSELAADITRISKMWEDERRLAAENGPWLFGRWSIADAFYAPVATRFRSYGVLLGELAADYQMTLLTDPALQAWVAAAASERRPS